MMKPDASCRVLILLQRPEAWVNVASLWQALQAREDVTCTILALPYNVLDPETGKEKAPLLQATLEAAGVSYETWGPDKSLRSGDFDAVVVTHPYDRERPRGLWFDALKSAVGTIIYVPYGLAAGGGRKNLRLQYAQPVHRHADLVVARSSFEKAQYLRYCPTGGDHVKVTGLPRFDSLGARVQEPLPADLLRFIGGRRTLLWNAHFSFSQRHSQSSNFSTFDLLGPSLFGLARRLRNELCLLWRPHPLLAPALKREGILDAVSLANLRDELSSLGIWWDDTADHSVAFAASEALVSDPGSFLFEYLALRRPLAALVNPEGEAQNAEAELLCRSVPTVRSPDQLHAFVFAVLSGNAPPPDDEIVERHLPMLDGRAGERVAAEILRLLRHRTRTSDEQLSGETIRFPPARSKGPSVVRDIDLEERETPALDALCSALSSIEELKRQEPNWRKTLRKWLRHMTTSLVEWVKQNPALLALATLRRSK